MSQPICDNCGLEILKSEDFEWLDEEDDDSPVVHSDMMDCIARLRAELKEARTLIAAYRAAHAPLDGNVEVPRG